MKETTWFAKGKAEFKFPDGKNFLENFQKAEGDDKLKLFFEWSKAVPFELYEELRAKAPFLEAPAISLKFPGLFSGISVDRSMIVTRRSDVLEILKNPNLLPIQRGDSRVGALPKEWSDFVLSHPKDGSAIRAEVARLTQQAFEDGAYIGRHHDKTWYGHIEIVRDVGRQVAFEFLSKLYGFKEEDKAALIEAGRAIQEQYLFPHFVTSGILRHGSASISEVEKIARETDGLKKISAVHDPLTGSSLVGTLLGSIESTQTAVAQALEQLLNHPAWLSAAISAARAGDHDAFARMVWEALRFNPANPVLFRYTREAVALSSNKVIPAHTLLLVSTHGIAPMTSSVQH